ncbi:hypothetical protein PEDI_10660 [Persicobacter diffluens]|uniref:Chromosome segregation protein SMC n=2 Tax=Persicobacter diffluens TaxID=981 RepID=A0AAN4VWG7_9BACT|nr:hypothetical protein PEDI_10660 [Persicobacter diffluens]
MDKDQLTKDNTELKDQIQGSRTNQQKMQRKRLWIILVTVALVAITLVTTFQFNRQNRELNENKAALRASYESLDSMHTLYEDRIQEIEALNGQSEELYRAKVQLESELDQIAEILYLLDGRQLPMREGQSLTMEGEEQDPESKYSPEQRKDMIDNALSSLKYKLVESQKRLKGYEQLLVVKDEEILKLKTVNEGLLVENQELKTKQNDMEANFKSLNQEKEKISEKLELAQKLRAKSIVVEGLNKRDKVYENPFRLRQLDFLRATIVLDINEVANVQGHQVYFRLIDGDGQLIMDPDGTSGEFKVKDELMVYSLHQEILFDNTGQTISFLLPNKEIFEKGEYKAEFYIDDYSIGTVPFRVR